MHVSVTGCALGDRLQGSLVRGIRIGVAKGAHARMDRGACSCVVRAGVGRPDGCRISRRISRNGKSSALWAGMTRVVLVRRLPDSTTSVLMERRAPSDPSRRRGAVVPTPFRLSADRPVQDRLRCSGGRVSWRRTNGPCSWAASILFESPDGFQGPSPSRRRRRALWTTGVCGSDQSPGTTASDDGFRCEFRKEPAVRGPCFPGHGDRWP